MTADDIRLWNSSFKYRILRKHGSNYSDTKLVGRHRITVIAKWNVAKRRHVLHYLLDGERIRLTSLIIRLRELGAIT